MMKESDILRKRWPLAAGLTLVAALVFAVPVLAAETVEADEEVVIAEDEVIEDDYFFAGSVLTVDGTIQGDLVAVGQTITVNGTVEGDLISGATSVVVNGEVQDDAYLAGYLIKLGENAVLADELTTAGYSVEMSEGSTIGGGVLFGSAQAVLGSDIAGDVKGGAGGAQIDGTIGGDVKLGVGDPNQPFFYNPSQYNPELPPVASVPTGLTLGENASIEGDLTYSSTAESDIPSGVVQGETSFELEVEEVAEVEEEFEFRPMHPGAALAFAAGRTVLGMVSRFLTLALVGLLIVWLGPKALTGAVETFKEKPWNSLGVGFLGYAVMLFALLVIPFLLILVGILLGIVSLGGLTLGVVGYGALTWSVLLVAFVTATSWLAKIVLGLWLGQLIRKAIQPEGTSLIPPLLIGVAIVAILIAIPVLGSPLLNFAIALFGLGAIILYVRGLIRPKEEASAAV